MADRRGWGAGLFGLFRDAIREAVRKNRVEVLFLLLMGLSACLVVVILATGLEGTQRSTLGVCVLVSMVIAGIVVLRRCPPVPLETESEAHIDDHMSVALVPTSTLPDAPLANAAPGEAIYAIGRTLKYWGDLARRGDNLLRRATAGGAELRFLMMDPLTDVSQLPQEERDIIERDYEPSLRTLVALSGGAGDQKCDLRLTTDLIHDSMRSMLVDTPEGRKHEITVDINTNAKRSPLSHSIEKLTLVIRGDEASGFCNRLRARAATLFEAGGVYLHEPSGELARATADIREGLAQGPFDPSRRNATASLFPQGRLTAILDAFDARRRRLLKLPRSVRPMVTPPPLCLHVEITDACGPCHCIICGRHRWTPPRHMPATMFERLLSSLASIGTRSIVLSGGEPFEHPDVGLFLAACAQYGVRVGVLSNGIGLSRFLADPKACDDPARLLAQSCDWIRVSVDGATEQQFAAVRRPSQPAPSGGWIEAMLDSLRQVRAAGGQANGPQLDVCFTLCRENSEHFMSMVECYRKNTDVIDACYFKFAHGSHLGDIAPTPGSVEAIGRQTRELLDRGDTDTHVRTGGHDRRCHGMNIDFLARFVKLCGATSIASGMPLTKAPPTKCFVPFMFSLVDARGHVYPCCHLYRDNISDRAPHVPMLGDLSDETF